MNSYYASDSRVPISAPSIQEARRDRILKSILALIFCTFVILPRSTYAQENAEAPEDTEAAEAIPLSIAAEEAGRLGEHLDRIMRPLPPADDLEGFEADLDDLALEIRRRHTELEHKDASGALPATSDSLEELQAREKRWRSYRRRLARVSRNLSNRLQAIDDARTALEQERERWEKTRRAAVGEPALPAIILEALRKIRERNADLRERRQSLLALQGRIPELNEAVEDALESVENAQRRRFDRLLRRDAAPVWTPEFWAPAGKVAELPELETAWNYLSAALTGLTWPLLLRHLLVLIFVLIIAGLLRRRTQCDEPLIAGAIFIAVAWAPYIYPGADPITLRFAAMLAALPLLWAAPRLRLPAAGLLVLVALYRLRLIGGPTHALAPTVEVLLALFLYGVIRRERFSELRNEEQPTAPGRNRALRVAELPALVLLLASAAYMIGYRSLSTVIGSNLIAALELAYIGYAGVRTAESFLAGIVKLPRLRTINFVDHRSEEIERGGERLFALAGLLWWIAAVLESMGLYDAVLELLASVFAAGISLGSLRITLGDLALFAGTITASFFVSRFVRAFLREDVYTRADMGRGVPYAISSITHYSILLIGLTVALLGAGFDLSKLALVAGALGVGIGFGLQNIVNNFVSGLILLLERPVQIGDYVLVGDLMGEVRRIGLRASRIRIIDGSEVIVPNAHLISEKLTNWTLTDHKRRLEVNVGVAYGTPPEPVLDILRRVAREHEFILDHPEPAALFLGFGDSSLDYRLLAWTANFDRRLLTESELHLAILREINAAGITIPFPQRDVHLFTQNVEGNKE